MTVIRYKTLSEQLYADSDYLTKLANQPKMREYCQEIINATVDINRAAFNLAHPEEKTGHWYIREMYPLECESWECSECKEVVYEKTKFCPDCGARMVSE